MKFTLPSQHVLYFGIQAKKTKVDTSGSSKNATANVAEIHNQVTMMLGYEIFDLEIGKRVLVDHAFIVAGGEITRAARNWLGNKLDAWEIIGELVKAGIKAKREKAGTWGQRALTHELQQKIKDMVLAKQSIRTIAKTLDISTRTLMKYKY